MAALTAMLFVQAAFALAACEDYRAQSRALLLVAQQAEAAPCHEQDATNVNAGLCVAHCQGMDQTLDKHQVKVPGTFLQAVLSHGFRPDTHQRRVPTARFPHKSAGPPARILFQSFLI